MEETWACRFSGLTSTLAISLHLQQMCIPQWHPLITSICHIWNLKQCCWPYTFSLFINGLIPHINSTTALYADDLTLVKPIKSTEDYDDLQQDLVGVHIWATVNKLPLSASKSKPVYFRSQTKALCPVPSRGSTTKLSTAATSRYSQ